MCRSFLLVLLVTSLASAIACSSDDSAPDPPTTPVASEQTPEVAPPIEVPLGTTCEVEFPPAFSRLKTPGGADVGFGNELKVTPGIPGCSTFCGSLPPTPDDIDSASVETLRDGSIRGRVGFLVVPSLLAYGTGGVAFQRVEANLTCSFAGPWCFPPVATDIRNETQADTLKGWTVGGGLEWLAHGPWLVRGEYRYADLGNFSPTFYEGTPGVVFTDIRVVTQVLTFGIGYKF